MLFPTSLVGSYPQPDWLIDRERLAGPVPAPGAGPGAVAGGPRSSWPRRSGTRPCWPSGPRRTRAWTSSPTARSAGRATPTGSPPRWTGWTSTTPARRWTAAGTPTRCRGSPGRSGAGSRSRSGDVRSCAAQHRPDHQDHRAGPVHHVPAGPERLLPRARRRPRWLRRGGQRGGRRTCSRPGPTSSSSTSPTCRPARRRPASTGSRRSTGRWRASPAPPPCTCASATRRSSTTGRRATRSCPSWPPAGCDQVSIETAQSGLDCSVLAELHGKTIILGVLEPRRPGRGDRRGGGRPGAAGAAVRARRAPGAGAGLRDEVPAPRRRRSASCGDDRGGGPAPRGGAGLAPWMSRCPRHKVGNGTFEAGEAGVRKIIVAVAAGALVAGLGVADASGAPAPPVRLAGSAVPFTASLPSTGLVPGGQRLTIQVWLAPRDPAGAAATPWPSARPATRCSITSCSPDAYTRRFGGTTAEAAAVTIWLRGAGFTAVAVGEQRSYIQATAPVSVIDAALRHQAAVLPGHQADQRRALPPARQRPRGPGPRRGGPQRAGGHRAGQRGPRPAAGPARPRQPPRPAGRFSARTTTASTGQLPAPRVRRHLVRQLDLRLHGLAAAPGLRRQPPDDRPGQTIALVELGLAPQMFVTLRDYARLDHMPAPSRSRYAELNLGKSSCPDLFDGEEQLDVEAAYDMALAARELVVGGNSCNNDLPDPVRRAAQDLGGARDKPLASIVSNSWEDPLRPTAAQKRLIHTILIRAAAEGVGMYFSTDDAGGAVAVGRPVRHRGRRHQPGHRQVRRPAVRDRLVHRVEYMKHHHWARPMRPSPPGAGPARAGPSPRYQKGIVPPALSRHGASRSTPDLSAVADPDTGIKLGLLEFPRKSPPRLSQLPSPAGPAWPRRWWPALVADAQQGTRPSGTSTRCSTG